MKLFEITLPQRDNAGRFCTRALQAFEQAALTLAGGFTRAAPADGAWHENGRDYLETVIRYRLACPQGAFLALREKAFQLFPDQLTIRTAELGTADIVYRDQPIRETLRVVS